MIRHWYVLFVAGHAVNVALLLFSVQCDSVVNVLSVIARFASSSGYETGTVDCASIANVVVMSRRSHPVLVELVQYPTPVLYYDTIVPVRIIRSIYDYLKYLLHSIDASNPIEICTANCNFSRSYYVRGKGLTFCRRSFSLEASRSILTASNMEIRLAGSNSQHRSIMSTSFPSA
jgi:hypothetical protein